MFVCLLVIVWLIVVGCVLAASVVFMVAIFVYRLHVPRFFFLEDCR